MFTVCLETEELMRRLETSQDAAGRVGLAKGRSGEEDAGENLKSDVIQSPHPGNAEAERKGANTPSIARDSPGESPAQEITGRRSPTTTEITSSRYLRHNGARLNSRLTPWARRLVSEATFR